MALFQTRQSNVDPNVQEIYNPQELGGRQAGQGFINTKELFDFAISQNLLGSRPSTVNPQVQELFDPKTGQGFTNELEAINFLTSLPAPVVQTTPVNVEIPETIPSTVLTETPVTSGDIATLVRQNQERMDRLMSIFQPTERETELGEELITRRQDLRRLNQLEREQVEAALNQPILESIGVGQAGQAQRTAALKRAAISEDIQALTDELGLLQSNRQSLREALQFQIDQGRFDVNLALQLREANKQEQEAAKNFALENNITTPYYNVGGTIYNTSTGKPFTSEEEFIKETGMKLGDAEAQGLVQVVGPVQEAGKFTKIGVDAMGNDIFGFVNETTGQVTPFNFAPSGGTNIDLGPIGGDLNNAFSSLSTLLSQDQRKAAQQVFNQFVQGGDIQGAKDYLKTLVFAAVPVEQKSRVIGREEALAALGNIQTLLNQFKQAGGDTGFFTGTIEDIANKIGRTTNPQLATIANQIRLAIVDYRRAVSGAAFTESEMQEYNRLFPSIGKISEFNEAIIQSLASSFRRNQETLIKTLIGDRSYDAVFGERSLEDLTLEERGAMVKDLMSQGFTQQEAMQAAGIAGPSPKDNSADRGGVTNTGMRTDRHNNPTAFTTDVARTAGLVEGVDYVAGDPFPNNPNLKTAKLLKDPVDTTIRVIDRIGFFTASGKPRWSYINQIPQAKNWNNLSYQQKRQVIAQMYRREGGTALNRLFV